MSDLTFIDIRRSEGLTYTSVEILQLAAIGSVQFSRAGNKYVYICAPRDQEGVHSLSFETDEQGEQFVQNLLGILRRKATVVHV